MAQLSTPAIHVAVVDNDDDGSDFEYNPDPEEAQEDKKKPKTMNPNFKLPKTRYGLPGVTYQHQSNAWMDSAGFQWWFEGVFQPFVQDKHRNEKVYLLMDNFSGHIMDSGDKNIEILALPKNCTSLHQPLDQGICNTVKSKFRKCLIDCLGACVSKWNGALADKKKKGFFLNFNFNF